MGRSADIVREACQVIWSDGEAERVGQYYHEDFKADYPLTNWGEGLEGVAALAKQVRVDLPGYAEEIEELIEADDEVVVRLRISGQNPQTGETVSFRDVTMLTIKDDKIIFQRGLTDYLSLFTQLGVIDFPQAG